LHLKSKLLGELFVLVETLPKKEVINFLETENNSKQISIEVKDTHKYGFKSNFVKKYEQALRDLANSISFGFK
jgi:hypothetical protein